MLWRQLRPAYRRLLRSGAEGQAVVRASKRLSQNRGVGAYAHELTLHLRFDDGSETTVTRIAEVKDLAGSKPGSVVPVRYDPDDHSRVEIDVIAIRRQKARARAESDSAAVADAEQSVAPNRSHPGA